MKKKFRDRAIRKSLCTVCGRTGSSAAAVEKQRYCYFIVLNPFIAERTVRAKVLIYGSRDLHSSGPRSYYYNNITIIIIIHMCVYITIRFVYSGSRSIGDRFAAIPPAVRRPVSLSRRGHHKSYGPRPAVVRLHVEKKT